MGYSISNIVATGEEAIRLAGEARPDLVLMDIRLLGQVDGIDAAREITQQYDVPVIFLTAFSDEELVRRARQVGAYGYLMKPFQDREVYASIEMAIEMHRMKRRREQRLRELERVQQRLEALRSVVPVCAKCHKVRNEQGDWECLEDFVAARTGARFTHWLCPSCYDEEMQKFGGFEDSEGI